MNKVMCEAAALRDFEAMEGSVMNAIELYGMIDHESVDISVPKGLPPIKVRVITTDRASIINWQGDFLDPFWNVEIAEPHPMVPDSIRAPWIYGKTYKVDPESRKHPSGDELHRYSREVVIDLMDRLANEFHTLHDEIKQGTHILAMNGDDALSVARGKMSIVESRMTHLPDLMKLALEVRQLPRKRNGACAS